VATIERLSVRAIPETVSGVRRAAVAFARSCGAADAGLSAVQLALSEAVTNAIVHAYVGVEPGTVTVSLTCDQDSGELHAVVCDDGSGMAPRADSPGMGLGMPLMAGLVKHLDIGPHPVGPGTRVCMTFDLDPA
jgi:serine/threonine-protein kinase RsbW